MGKYLRNPIYCGVLLKSWSGEKMARKMAGTQIISPELFNEANKEKISVVDDEESGKVYVMRGRIPDYLLFKNVHNDLYPYKQFVLCTVCRQPLYGSASRGKLGKKHYPAYHCSRTVNGEKHYYRIKLSDFKKTVEAFVKNVKLTDKEVMRLKEMYVEELEQARNSALSGSNTYR